jgi:hypothetical protein
LQPGSQVMNGSGNPHEADSALTPASRQVSSGRVYDPERRRAAEELEGRRPAWLVMYGSWSRHLWAWSRFSTRDGKSILITSRDPVEMDERMSALELEHRTR